MRRAAIVMVLAGMLAGTTALPAQAAARPKVRTWTTSLPYTGPLGVRAERDIYVYGTTLPLRFHPPMWTRSMTVSVRDASGLPVHFTSYVNNAEWRFLGCGASPLRIRFNGVIALWVEPDASVRSDCATPVSVPTTGRVVVTFSSKT